MDEDRLSRELGRLIDEAKAAARSLGVDDPAAEGVAVLTEEGTVHCGAGIRGAGSRGAAALALESARAAGHGEILAAAVAVPGDATETVLPSAESYRCLVGLDSELPLVFKQFGRWVVLPVSTVGPRLEADSV
jgi:hypothetical protein